MKLVQIINNKIANVVVVDPENIPEEMIGWPEVGVDDLSIYEDGQTPSDTLQIGRERASLSRRDFCLGLAKEGILSDADAINAARGDWPSALSDFLSMLDSAQALEAQIEWAAAQTIQRLHPLVLSLGSWLSLPEEAIDRIFRIIP